MELRTFLRRCFDVPESEIFVSSDNLVDEALRDVHRDGPFAVFCTFGPVGGDFAATFSISSAAPPSEQDAMDPHEFIDQLAAHTGSDILCNFGDEPQPWLWTLTRSHGSRVPVHLTEEFDELGCNPPCHCEYTHLEVVYPKS
ncbi:hypothetical protein OHA40_17470 [Nocardia sp. NBC_00508]|uniref:hypothetical protein n=1 Tax=Nocardia sp. NBC_00508 TaxID=2975992 RepID=UPI002E7FCEB7|nr:hypothetical protein [Nocardia sp. NBC_00508]WUD63575.1 hypothetical protein OHA40_17470 [Nocardia sp. NBC_00508]